MSIMLQRGASCMLATDQHTTLQKGASCMLATDQRTTLQRGASYRLATDQHTTPRSREVQATGLQQISIPSD